jgi:hypothetical protein
MKTHKYAINDYCKITDPKHPRYLQTVQITEISPSPRRYKIDDGTYISETSLQKLEK